jgi:hypothetical protein
VNGVLPNLFCQIFCCLYSRFSTDLYINGVLPNYFRQIQSCSYSRFTTDKKITRSFHALNAYFRRGTCIQARNNRLIEPEIALYPESSTFCIVIKSIEGYGVVYVPEPHWPLRGSPYSLCQQEIDGNSPRLIARPGPKYKYLVAVSCSPTHLTHPSSYHTILTPYIPTIYH